MKQSKTTDMKIIAHQQLTGIMHLALEKQLPEEQVIDMALEHQYQHTSTNALWNYTTIKNLDDFEPTTPAA